MKNGKQPFYNFYMKFMMWLDYAAQRGKMGGEPFHVFYIVNLLFICVTQ